VRVEADMIKGHEILCFAPGPWDDIWRNRHQIMSRLARANRVLYVEPWPYLRAMLRSLRRGQLRWVDLRGPRLSRVSENLYVYRPAGWAPRAGRSALSSVTQAIYMAQLRRVLRRLEFRTPMAWLFQPDMEVFVGQFNQKLVIYHVVDEYAGYAGVSETWRPVMQRMEQHLAQRADLVFVTSPALWERKRALNERVYLVPNAVDYQAFVAVADSGAPPPEDVATLARPIAGYVGAINDKVDLALLARTARELGAASLILVGPVSITDEEGRRALAELRALPNVRLLGRRSVEDVPRYIAACDVCLLPYRVNEWTRNIDSLKLYEYLACGKPVVATDVPAARQFPVVTIVAGEQDLAASIRAAWREDNHALRDARRNIAAQNTWDERVDALSAAIQARLEERTGRPERGRVQGGKGTWLLRS
jgi:glycosyltransferase involved in cell wall biosynthesis